MKILKKILIVLIIIVALVGIIGLFIPSHFHMEKSSVMKSSPESVYNQVDDLKNWNNWMPWNKMDPNWKLTYGEKTEGQGASYSWESTNSNVGSGTATITEDKPNEKVATNLEMGGDNQAISTIEVHQQDDGTKTTWAFDCELGSNPFKKVMVVTMMNMFMGKQFEQGLKDLETSAQQNPVQAPTATAQDSIPAASPN